MSLRLAETDLLQSRDNKNVDEVMELPQIKEEWDRLVALRENELVNEKAAAAAVDGGSLMVEEEEWFGRMDS